MLNDVWGIKRWLAYALSVLLALPPAAAAQATTTTPQGSQSATSQPATSQPATVRSLKVIALAGNREMNDLENKVMAPLVVQVLDQNDQPVEGADVTFRFPLAGPGAAFPGDKSAQTVRTNVDGQAAATGWMANAHLGTFQIQVTAFRGTEEGSTVISMTNVTRITEADRNKNKNKKWWSTKWGKVAIIAGAAGIAAAIVLAVHGTGSSNGKVITAVPGSPTIGAPQ